MGMPKIPEGTNRPNKEQIVIDLLESVALEEMAAAHLLNAQGEKLQALVQKFSCNEIDYCAMENSCASAQRMINSVIMNQWLLINRLSIIPQMDGFRGTENPSCEPRNPSCDGKQSACNNCTKPPSCGFEEMHRPICGGLEEPCDYYLSQIHQEEPSNPCKNCPMWDKCNNPKKCLER